MFFTKKNKKFLSFFAILVTLNSYSQNTRFKVTLDAGHGGHDYGAVYNGRIEKNIALAVVLKVGAILEKTKKIDVVYTRKTDVFIDLIERANIANRDKSDIFVSIHCNANRNTAADGTETYVMGLNKLASNLDVAKKENSVITYEKNYKQKYEGFDPNSPESILGLTLMQEEFLENSIFLASKVEEQFGLLGKKIRQGGVKQAPFMVLHKAYMPRVLIEMGFISNPVEGDILNSEEGQQEIAEAISKAIISYKNEYFGEGFHEVKEVLPPTQLVEKPIKDSSFQTQSNPVVEVHSIEKKEPKNDNAKIIYKVQITTSSKKIPLKPSNFNDLNALTLKYENKTYVYMYGKTSDYEEAKRLLGEAKIKGFSSAFLVAFKNGKKITIQEALNL